MTKKEHEQLVEKALRDFQREAKEDKDRDTVRAYGDKLRSTVKNYTLKTSAVTTGGRKNRAICLGECILQAADKLERESKDHNFVPGSLAWTFTEDRVQDPDGRKGYQYTVKLVVATDEAAYTDEEIQKELEDLTGKLAAETEEMFREEAEEEEPLAEVQDVNIQ